MRLTMMVLGATLLLAGASRADFFDGKSLTGFDGLKEYWKTDDGSIVGTSPGINFNTFRFVEVYAVVTPMYLVTGYAILFLLRRLERRYAVGR